MKGKMMMSKRDKRGYEEKMEKVQKVRSKLMGERRKRGERENTMWKERKKKTRNLYSHQNCEIPSDQSLKKNEIFQKKKK